MIAALIFTTGLALMGASVAVFVQSVARDSRVRLPALVRRRQHELR